MAGNDHQMDVLIGVDASGGQPGQSNQAWSGMQGDNPEHEATGSADGAG